MLSAALTAPRHVASRGSYSAVSWRSPAHSAAVAPKTLANSSTATKLSLASLRVPGSLSTRFFHLSSRVAEESLYDFERPAPSTSRRRKSSSDSPSPRSGRRSSASPSSPRFTPRSANSTQGPRVKDRHRNRTTEEPAPVKPKKPEVLEDPANHRLYREESDAIKYTTISAHPKISISEVSYTSSRMRTFARERNSAPPKVDNYTIMPTVIVDGLNKQYGAHSLPINSGIRPGSATDDEQIARAKTIAVQLEIPYFDTPAQMRQAGDIDFCLVVGSNHISLINLQEDYSPAVFSDFIAGPTAHRKSTGGSDPKSPAMRAATINGKTINDTHIVDATGGLGVDGFMFASAGFNVTMLEKNPLVYTLLSDAYQRAAQVPHLKTIMSRIRLEHIDAVEWFAKNANSPQAPDVIYLDPMYPIESRMKALPKKGMAIARALIGKTDRADELVRQALPCAKEKVVLKRPYYSDDSKGTSTVYKSRSLRFEVFTRESWDKVGPSEEFRVPSPTISQIGSM